MTVERRVIRVTGHVQGVNFRRDTRREAQRLGLRGFARNEPDGSVTIDVEGEPEALDQMIAWCCRGPELAIVDCVDVDVRGPVGHCGFSIE